MKIERRANRLVDEASPYLRQHAYNPVDWYPWGEEAFAKARRENKPILLSIGYSTCHWCHVMERESFENEQVAEILNGHYVAIKVDREERPDLDKVYMAAYQAMTEENGGWPLNVVLTPELKPFYGGTYFPPTSREGRVGFIEALQQLHDAWEMKRERVLESSEALRAYLQERSSGETTTGDVPDLMCLARAAVIILENGDHVEGGWGSGVKFPQPSHLGALLREWVRSGDERYLSFAKLTADKMADGGIRDQLGGGYHRYAVDRKWLVPHFEIMLYDQAQLLDFYLDMWLITREERYAEVARGMADYVLRVLRHEIGGFLCAQDAQSEGKEGKYFCWTTEELQRLLTREEYLLVKGYYGLSDEGNFYDYSDPEALEGQNVLSLPHGDGWVTLEPMDAQQEQNQAILRTAIAKMTQERAMRVPPATDDKVLASWNGMMIGALARAGVVLEREDYLEAAKDAQKFIRKNLWDGQRLAHRWHARGIDDSAQAESYLLMLQSARRLYELTLDEDELAWALTLADAAVEIFYDQENGGFFESASVPDVMVRLKGDYDGAVPTASSVAVLEFLKLAEITGREDLREIATKTLRAHGETLHQMPSSLSGMLTGLHFYHADKLRLVVAEGEGGVNGFLKKAHGSFRPLLTVMGNRGLVADFQRSLLAQNGLTTGYLCEGQRCHAPEVDSSELGRLSGWRA